MRKLHHPNVIRLEEVFETPKTMMLVLEYAQGTELFDSILQVGRFREQACHLPTTSIGLGAEEGAVADGRMRCGGHGLVPVVCDDHAAVPPPQKRKYSEEDARPIFEQLAHALAYLHSLNIVHRCGTECCGPGACCHLRDVPSLSK